MKITNVSVNNRKKAFEVDTPAGHYVFPYALVRPTPTRENRVVSVQIDEEMGQEGFVYSLSSGEEGAVHIDHVLEYNKEPGYMADMLLYNLTLYAQEALKSSKLSRRELIRRLGTSPTQFYRLLDQSNYHKSMHQLMTLLHLLHYDIDVVLRSERSSGGREKPSSVKEVRVSSLSNKAIERNG
jgi:hypothetical protein